MSMSYNCVWHGFANKKFLYFLVRYKKKNKRLFFTIRFEFSNYDIWCFVDI